MTKPAGQEGSATSVRSAPAAGDDPFGLAPWLKEMPGIPLHPLMAHPMAAMAATTAIGLGIAGQFAGLMLGAMQGATARAKTALDEAAETVKKTEVKTTRTPPEETERKLALVRSEPAAAPAKAEEPPAAVPEAAVTAKPKMTRAKAPQAKATQAKVARAKTPPAPSETARAKPVRKSAGAKAAKADDLKAISGIGPKLEQVLNGMGYRRYVDIAAWSAADVERIEAELGLDGRIARDGWVEQARTLAKGRG